MHINATHTHTHTHTHLLAVDTSRALDQQRSLGEVELIPAALERERDILDLKIEEEEKEADRNLNRSFYAGKKKVVGWVEEEEEEDSVDKSTDLCLDPTR